MKKKIEKCFIYFEQLKVRFEGESQYYFMRPEELQGLTINIHTEPKRTRTWVEVIKPKKKV